MRERSWVSGHIAEETWSGERGELGSKQWRKLAAVRERSLGSGQIAEETWSGKRVRLGSGQRAEEA